MSIPLRNLSIVAFQDYYRLRKDADSKNEKLYDTVMQHNKDNITYEDLYETLKMIDNDNKKAFKQLSGKMNTLFNIPVDAIGYILMMLVHHGYLKDSEVKNALKDILKMYDEDQKIKKELDNSN